MKTTQRLLIARKVLICAFSAAVVLVFGQNCSNGFTPEIYLDHLSSNSPSSAEFTASKAILTNRCASCHGAGGSQSHTRLDLATEQQFTLSGFVIAGKPDESKLLQRLRNYSGNSALKDMPPTGPIPDSEYQTLRRWIMAMGATTTPESNPYACNANEPIDNKVLFSKIQALSDLQYTNTIKDFLALTVPTTASGIYSRAVAPVTIPTNTSARYPRNISDVSKDRLMAYFNISDKLATELTNSTNAQTFLAKIISFNSGACFNPTLTVLSSDCVNQFVRNLGLRLYRRPLIEAGAINELEAFKQEFALTADRAKAMSNLIMRMMMSQNFLFRMEDQEIQSPTNPKLLQLSSYAVANRLSYTFWNTMPDETLLGYARNGSLQDDLRFAEAMNYVLSSAKVDSSYKEFAQGYLLLNKTPVFSSSTSSLQHFNNGIQFDLAMTKAMNSEAEELVSYIAKNNGKFNDLFTTDISFARHTPLMQVYGVTMPAPPTITPQNAVRMPAGTRAGILTRAALLAEESGGQHLIHRAVRIKRDLLCISQAPAPADVNPVVPLTPAQYQTYTFRQRTAHDTGTGSCFACHQTINPYGFPLSKYNGLGFYSNTEPAFTSTGILTGAQLPTDSTSDLTGVLSGVGQISDAIQFSSVIGSRPEAQRCFTTNYASYFLGREPDVEKEGCRLNKMFSIIKAGTLKDAMSSIATDVEFRHRKID